MRLDAALRAAGASSRLIVLPGAGHGGSEFDAATAREAILAFVRQAAAR